MSKKLSAYVQEFFSIYLPITRNFSSNTIETYKYSFLIFNQFLKSKKIDIDSLTLENMTYQLVEEFITWLKDTKGNSPKTINVRINSLKAFFSYIETKNLVIYDVCTKIKNIKQLKVQKKIPEYLTINEIKLLLNSIDTKSTNGLKELVMLSLIYDGAMRASELCEIRVKNLIFNSKKQPYIFIEKGKGNKQRTIPISNDVKELITLHINRNKLEEDSYLFYNKYGNKYTRSGIRYILNKNYKKAKEKCADKTMFIFKSHPHMLRHSKAMHMTESGINLIIIRDYLGHASIQSTEIYARVSQAKQDEIILKSAKNKPLYIKKSKKEIITLENWLRNSMKK